MITVYIKKIANINDTEKQNIINSLSFYALKRLNKKRNEDLFLASLCALSLLTNEQRANLEYTENGNPFFLTLDSDISISHSKTYVTVAISNSKTIPVGIDVEEISNANLPIRFLSENEKKIVTKENNFIEIWTKKEALFKFLKNDSTPFIQLDSTAPQKYGAYFSTVQIENALLTVCAKENEKIEIIKK